MEVNTTILSKFEQTLPVGIVLSEKRHTTYTIACLSELLRGDIQFEIRQVTRVTEAVAPISRFLAKTIPTIGGLPLIEITERLGVSPQEFFEGLPCADVCTMMYGIRRKAVKELRIQNIIEDFGDTEVKFLSGDSNTVSLPLSVPIEIKGEQVESFVFQPPRFNLSVKILQRGLSAHLAILKLTIGDHFNEETLSKLVESDAQRCFELGVSLMNLGIDSSDPWLRNPADFLFPPYL